MLNKDFKIGDVITPSRLPPDIHIKLGTHGNDVVFLVRGSIRLLPNYGEWNEETRVLGNIKEGLDKFFQEIEQDIEDGVI